MGEPAIVLMILLAGGALLIRVGMGMYVSGMTRAKSGAGAIFRTTIEMAIATLAFWAIGAAILNATGHPIFGLRMGLLFDAKDEASGATFLQLVLVLLATAPLTAAMGERSKLLPTLIAPALLGAIVVPMCGHWAWSGWLRHLGFVDIGGASAVHVAGGLSALMGAIFVGARRGKFNRDGSTNFIPGHNIPLAAAGALVMLVAWVPYVAGASVLNGGLSSGLNGRIGLNVILAASSGAIAALALSCARIGRADVTLTFAGLLGGLVAMSAGGGAVSTLAAVCTGAIAGLLVPAATSAMELRCKIDDPSGLVAIQFVGGAWGTLAVGLFSASANWSDRFSQFGIQLLGLAAIASVAVAFSAALFAILRMTVGLRLSEDAEYDGTDLVEHDLNAYPDFQQNMIKSYHLREG